MLRVNKDRAGSRSTSLVTRQEAISVPLPREEFDIQRDVYTESRPESWAAIREAGADNGLNDE